MDRFGTRLLCRLDDVGNVQVALAGARRANADGLIGKADVQGVTVGIAIDGNGLDSQFFTGADHP